MSDDLISRKALMEKVLQEEYDNDIHKDGRAKAIHHGEYQYFYKTISEMPTAYDVDKVVEQLWELKTYKLNLADAMSEIMRRGELGTYVCLEDTLEIVKSGGVADE